MNNQNTRRLQRMAASYQTCIREQGCPQSPGYLQADLQDLYPKPHQIADCLWITSLLNATRYAYKVSKLIIVEVLY